MEPLTKLIRTLESAEYTVYSPEHGDHLIYLSVLGIDGVFYNLRISKQELNHNYIAPNITMDRGQWVKLDDSSRKQSRSKLRETINRFNEMED